MRRRRALAFLVVLASATLSVSCAGSGESSNEHAPRLNASSLRQALNTCRGQLSAQARRKLPVEGETASASRLFAAQRRCNELLRHESAARGRAQLEAAGWGKREEARASRIVDSGRGLRGLLRGRRHTTQPTGPWFVGGKLVGGLVEVEVRPPLRRARTTIPIVETHPDGTRYLRRKAQFRILEARRLNLLAEFETNRVVSVQFVSGSSVQVLAMPKRIFPSARD